MSRIEATKIMSLPAVLGDAVTTYAEPIVEVDQVARLTP